jgi:aspartate carbamoyltransferase catalytic subunit
MATLHWWSFALFFLCGFPLFANPLKGRDLLSIEDLSREEIELILDTAETLKKTDRSEALQGLVLATCFFEPSTRTRLSFEASMHYLGGSVIGFSDAASTSTKKGEALSDTIKTVSCFSDIIVVRHPQEGSAKIAAAASDKPVINGGDGSNQHPTQTLLDLFSIRESQGTIDGLHIALAGDLKYSRTIHSLCRALSLYNVHLYFVSPLELPLPADLYDQLQKARIPCSFHESLDEIMPQIDILYMTRIQKERFPKEMPQFVNSCLLQAHHLKHVKENLRILHPLPRVDEIDVTIDDTPYAYYFHQVGNGILVRKALLLLLLGKTA